MKLKSFHSATVLDLLGWSSRAACARITVQGRADLAYWFRHQKDPLRAELPDLRIELVFSQSHS